MHVQVRQHLGSSPAMLDEPELVGQTSALYRTQSVHRAASALMSLCRFGGDVNRAASALMSLCRFGGDVNHAASALMSLCRFGGDVGVFT